MDLYELIEKLRKRPSLYLGKPSIEHLQVFLDGYTFARRQLNIPITKQEREFEGFQNWVECRFNQKDTQSWAKIILFYSEDERAALDSFFDCFDDFVTQKQQVTTSDSDVNLESSLVSS